MQEITIPFETLHKIDNILWQLWWPTKYSYTTRIYTDLTILIIREMIKLIKDSIKNKSDLMMTIFSYFVLIRILDYIILDLGEDEFQTVTWLNYYEDWILLLHNLRKGLVDLDKSVTFFG